MDATKKKKNSIMRYVIYMLILTVAITMVSVSRYSTSITMCDVSKVADFNVVITHTAWGINGHPDNNVEVFGVGTSGGSKTYVLTVNNYSEVAIRARLVVDSADIAVTYNSDWVDMPIGSPAKDFTATVYQETSMSGNDVRMHIEYEQID